MVQCRDSGVQRVWLLTCFSIKSQAAKNKNITHVLNNVCADKQNTHTPTSRTHAYKRTNTHNRKSVNEWEGAGGLEGLCWWKIWLLSTSAFLNTHSYLPSPQEERSFLFSFLLGITVLSASPHFCFPLLLQPFLPSHLSTPLLSFYTPPPLFIFYFFQQSPIFFSIPLHPSPRHPLLPPPLLVVSYALSGTAHSATKQSCLQQHTLANQARPEFSSPQILSTTPWYPVALDGRGFSRGGEAAERRRSINIHGPI